MRCYLIQPKPIANWISTSISYIYTKCNRHVYKAIIDGGSNFNFICMINMSKFRLKIEPHPCPYNIT